jgi:hypothetical protein
VNAAGTITAQSVFAALKTGRFSLVSEKETQAEIAAHLTARAIAHVREVDIGNRDIIDFMVDTIGIEVKIGGGKRAIYAQCERYCKTGKLTALILMTSVAIGFPREVNGIPCFVLSMGRAWL